MDDSDVASVAKSLELTVAMFTRYDALGASSRVRFYQYEPHLQAFGMLPLRKPLFSDDYLHALYRNGGTRRHRAVAFLARIEQLRRNAKADVCWLEKEAVPWMPWLIEKRLLPTYLPLVVDYDDAVFHNYDIHSSALIRAVLGNKIDHVMARATIVTAGNSYLADRARHAGARQVEVVPTVVDANVYKPAPSAPADGPVGWIGTPTTFKTYVKPKLALFERIAVRTGAAFRFIGAGCERVDCIGMQYRDWSAASEVSAIQELAVGIMPLEDSPWARGKCGYKLIQYMACGIPVVASPVGVNREIVVHGVNGLLASTEQEWVDALAMLRRDAALRLRMGAEGRRMVEHRYSLDVWGPRMAALLGDAASRKLSS